MSATRGTIALVGSGELSPTMVELHKELLARLGPTPNAVFLDTPAGFQLNADEISRKAVEYFRKRVGRKLTVASLKSTEATFSAKAETAYRTLRQADYVLVGPGSPTYAVRQWKRSPVPAILAARVEAGGCLVAASAAALALGRFTLPVYEIYKVGEEIHWAEGIDVFGLFGLTLAVVPHWNNTEGGSHDTRFCYMGEPRFRTLEALLPESVAILGIDEHTVAVLELEKDEASVRGAGHVTVRRSRMEAAFGPGDRLPLDLLRGPAATKGASQSPRDNASNQASGSESSIPQVVSGLEAEFFRRLHAGDAAGAASSILDLERFLWNARRELGEDDQIDRGRRVLREATVSLAHRIEPPGGHLREGHAALLRELLALRAEWRSRGKWDEADALRARLLAAGVIVEDDKEESRWRFTTRKDG